MAESESDAGARNFAVMSLHVFAQNKRALQLYEKFGYREFGRQPVVPHPRLIFGGDILLMTKQL